MLVAALAKLLPLVGVPIILASLLGAFSMLRDISTTQDFLGWIDELRITKGIARYTSGFTPPSEAFPDS